MSNISNILKKYVNSSGFIVNYDYSNIVKCFFKDTMNLKYVPKNVIKFYASCNGIIIKFLSDIFSLDQIKEEYEHFDEFIKAMELEDDMKKYNLVPIADDGMGGYYVFKSNVKDDHIYYLDSEYPEKLEK